MLQCYNDTSIQFLINLNLKKNTILFKSIKFIQQKLQVPKVFVSHGATSLQKLRSIIFYRIRYIFDT